MSTDCPPQLQLSIQPNTTSFKRSFEQFGFDLESPGGGGTAGATHAATSDGRNERNKRARSTVSFDSESASDSSDNTAPSTSSSSTSSQASDIIVAFPPAALAEAPRLPTPVTQDVEMADYSSGESRPHPRDEYRLSLHRFNQFDNEMALLRQSSPATPPPTLPPLRHRLSPDDQTYFHRRTPSNPSFSTDIFSDNSSSRTSYDAPHVAPTDAIAPPSEVSNSSFDLVFREIPPLSLPTINLSESPPPSPILTAAFRDRLNTALEGLRSPSPLVPGLEDAAPELREMEEDTEDSEESQSRTVIENNRSRTYELPPILPPIQTSDHDLDVADSSPVAPETPSSQLSPVEPPVLPPIPIIGARIDSVDGAWQSRGPESPDRLDNASSLARRTPQSEPSGFRLASSAQHNSTSRATLVDHPLPSPVLRDLHSWIEERRPVSPVDVHHRHHFPRADGPGSLSSISTTAATAGTDPTERDILSNSAVSPASPSAPPEPTPHDRLSRILDRVRSAERTGQSIRRAWQSHGAPWASSNAESDILLDLLPWYPNSPEQLASMPTSESSEPGRPISTTPALAHLVHPSLDTGDDMRLLDSFWDPIFTNLPNVRLRFGSQLEDTVASATTLERPLHYLRRPPDEGADRSEGNVPGDRRSPRSAEAGSAPLRLLQPPTRPRGNVETEYMDYFSGVATESPLGSTNVAGASGYRDRHASQSDANSNLGIWRPLESMELSLDLDLATPHSSETPAESNVSHVTPSSALHEQGPTSIPRPYVLHNPAASSSNDLRLDQDRHRARSSEEIMRRTAAHRMLERRQNMRLVTDFHEAATENTRPEVGALTSPTYWNLSHHARSAAADTSVSLQADMLNPAPRASAPSHQQSSASASTPSSSPSASVPSERWHSDPRYRPRSIRAYTQTRFPSSNSLVAENMAEVRRRAEQAEILRAYPAYQGPSVRSDAEDSHMFADDQREDYVRQSRPIDNVGRGGHRRALSAESAGLSTNTASRTSDVSDFMDTTESIHTGLFSHSGGAGAVASGIFAPSPPQPPTLPSPDLGGSFNASPQSSRAGLRSWMPDVSEIHSPSTFSPSSTTNVLYNTDGTADRTYPFTERVVRSRLEASTVPLELNYLRERNQRELARLQQQRSDDTDNHDRHRPLWHETVNESSRLIESASRVREYMPHNGVNETLLSRRQSYNPRFRPVGDHSDEPHPSSSPTRPAATSPRHMEPSGRYSYFDPSSFTAGPFRNTLQHMVGGRDYPSNINPIPNAPNVYSRARPTPPYSSLPLDREVGYGFPSAARPEPMSTRARSFYPARESNESERYMHNLQQHSHPDFHSRIFPSAGEISDIGGIENRWFRENQRAEVNSLMSSRLHEAPNRMDGDSQRHINSPSSAEDQPTNTTRSTANMHRLRRTLLTNRLEEIEELAASELLLVRGSRNPRRGMRGHPATLARLPQGHTGVAMGVPHWRRGRPLGDFMRDEDFDDSYESLLSLSMQIGDAKPRATPSEVLEKMQKGLYRDFAGEGTDTRCPICLDDYEPTDPIQKMNNCSHWLHENCLGQWLQTANTCPVCREPVVSRSSPFSGQRAPRFRAMPFHLHPARRRTDTSPVANTSQEPYVALSASNNDPSPDFLGQNATMPDMEHSIPNQPSQRSPTRDNSGAPWRSRRH